MREEKRVKKKKKREQEIQAMLDIPCGTIQGGPFKFAKTQTSNLWNIFQEKRGPMQRDFQPTKDPKNYKVLPHQGIQLGN